MKKGTAGFVAGFVLGAVMFGGAVLGAPAMSVDIVGRGGATERADTADLSAVKLSAVRDDDAAGIIANPATSKILVDGKEVKVEAYNIEGRNYLQLRDMAAAVDFSVVWDGAGNRVLIDTSRGYDPNEEYVPETTPGTAPASARPAPASTKAGDVVKTTDGGYTINKGKPAEEALPAPDPEWAKIYPAIVLPNPTPVRSRGTHEFGEYDQLNVFNAHETQRMIDALYKYAPNNKSLWENDDPSAKKPRFTISVELTAYASEVNHFFPWRESEIEKQIRGGAKIYKIYAMDIYSRGNYLYTMYCIDPALS